MSPAHGLGDFDQTVALLGAGKMGTAMLQGWLSLGFKPSRLTVIEPQVSDDVKALAGRGIRLNPPLESSEKPSAIVIAVKPQVAAEALPPLARVISPATVVISIMAGRAIAFLERMLPNAAIVRAMPNTPAAIGRGITVAVGNARVSAAQRDLAHRLLAATGTVEWLDEESLMDAVTAVSGSGPAYVFLLAESLTKAGVAAGLPPALAAKLARETVAGSGELLHRSPLSPEMLRRNVTSPGGTTAAALEVLMEPSTGLDPLMSKAVAAAVKRSRELAG